MAFSQIGVIRRYLKVRLKRLGWRLTEMLSLTPPKDEV